MTTSATADWGRPVVLLHGYASNRNEGWRRVGWYGAFERKRIRVIALDWRGHGESAKPHAPEAYARASMVGDVFALLDHLHIGRADLFGYSMGARLAVHAVLAQPERIADLILGGIGERILQPSENEKVLAAAMETQDAEAIADPILRSFRAFADEQGEDRLALAACARGADYAVTAGKVVRNPRTHAGGSRCARRTGRRSAGVGRTHSGRAVGRYSWLRPLLGNPARAVQGGGIRLYRRRVSASATR